MNVNRTHPTADQRVWLRITLDSPPANVDFGIQEGKGSDFNTILTQRSTGADIIFEFKIAIKGRRDDGSPNFAGPYVQGPPSARFVYVDIGTHAGQTNTPWQRRLKVSLNGITPSLVKEALTDPKAIIEVTLPGTGRDGGPSCASVKPSNDWRCVKWMGAQ